MPRVCDACKERDENDNEIVDNLCKNDFGKSTHLFSQTGGSQSETQGPRGGVLKGIPGTLQQNEE